MRAHTVPMKMSNRIRFTFGIVSVGPFLNGCAAIARSEYAAHTHSVQDICQEIGNLSSTEDSRARCCCFNFSKIKSE